MNMSNYEMITMLRSGNQTQLNSHLRMQKN